MRLKRLNHFRGLAMQTRARGAYALMNLVEEQSESL